MTKRKAPLKNWPECSAQSHARVATCKCGHVFYKRKNRNSEIKDWQNLQKGDIATVTGVIAAGGVKRIRGGRSMFEFIMDDGTARLNCRWWNMPYMNRYYKTGDTVHVHGKISIQKPVHRLN